MEKKMGKLQRLRTRWKNKNKKEFFATYLYSFVIHTRMDRLIGDKTYLKLFYYVKEGKKLNLKNPKTLNEKLQWLKLYDHNPLYTTLVDKYAVKKYVADKIGVGYIVPTLGVWKDFDSIDFNSLPNQFVLKCTHDSGSVIVVKEKETLDKLAAKMKLEKSLKENYYLCGREWPYKNVEPRIIAEKYITSKIRLGGG